ncbi:SusC/RagA family TonB-linked outer membrane protein [Zunongwangia sp. F363]|uniref:SusC/RagA family TonB-linked outer membrane protein n=1 Tax=Autumnicola tepida TaxID=3075595 RepID=A0ABU3CBP4_9FLAO|nr:SusC/RagA family TonB-linked outer membrane protein [Zunongwangia sp. F363]MDT0643763.1 SusC/RagA family TonB-linked outer membrane protein [Zunongwangia sp. F363]
MKSKLHFLYLVVFLLPAFSLFAQEKTVTGTVTDEQDLPLPGVNVLLKNTSTGVQTDFDGIYSISAAPGDILVFSFLGLETKEVTVGTQDVIDVSLASDASELDEVIVTAFGGTKQRRATTYATATIDDEELNETAPTSIFESLSGKIAGANITTPAQPGASSKVIIRGFTSITGSNSPLYIIDGTPINADPTGSTGETTAIGSSIDRTFDAGNGISDIDPNIIEKITVLKGAAATALYGNRAANGAILITTKKGKQNDKISIDFSSAVDYLEVSRVPHFQNGWGQGWAGASYSSLPDGSQGASNENGSWGAAFNGAVRPWGQIVDNSQLIKPYSPLEDNVREFYDIGQSFSNSIRLSGGNEFSTFALTVSDLTVDGVIPTEADKLNRRAINFNGGMTGKGLSVKLSANYVKKDQNVVNTGQGDNAGQGSTFMQEIIQVPRDISLLDLEDYVNNPFNSPGNFYTPYAQNPYFVLNENATTVNEDRLFGNINLKYDFDDFLYAVWQIGGDIRNERVSSYGAIVDYPEGSPQDLLNATEVVGGVSELKRTRKEYDTYFNAVYDRYLTEDLNLGVVAGINYNERQSNYLNVAVTGLDIPNYYELGNSANRPEVSQADLKRRSYGLYGQVELAFLDRYFLNLTARNDWSSTLPVENNSFFYPSASLSAVLLDNNLHYFKLRGAWSRVGNDTDPYLTESTLIQGVSDAYFGEIQFPIGGVNSYELASQLGNSELKPEITEEVEVGFESSFFDNRINLDVALYDKQTSDLIVNLPIDPSTGFSFFAGNFADVQNRGIEAVLGFTPVRTSDLTWDFTYTFTKNENEVTRLLGGLDKLTLTNAYGVNFYAVEGQPLGVFYAAVPARTEEGEYIVNPDTGFYEMTDDEQPVGTSQRDFIMGLSSRITYKNFSLSGSLDWKEGGKMYSYTARLLGFTGNSLATTFNERKPFIIPNSVVETEGGEYVENTTPVAYDQITNFYNASQNGAIESTHVIDKTFIRIRDVSLTYTVDSGLVQKLGLRNASVSAYGKNIFMWTPAENPYVDPEVSTYGSGLLSEFGEFSANPAQRSYGVKLNIGL